jgi:hypothetical protein
VNEQVKTVPAGVSAPASPSYKELRAIDVAKYIEKRGKFSYLSWSWAVDTLLLHDQMAQWEYTWIENKPFVKIGNTAMVFCTVTAFGVSRTAQLPVMDHMNRAIEQPDAFQLNTAMQRCLAKAIALHGIGLYIYAGEDLPPVEAVKVLALGAAEVDTIVKLAAKAGVEPMVIAESYGVSGLEQVPMSQFAEIVDRLQKRALALIAEAEEEK